MNKEQLQQEYKDGRRDFTNLDLSGLDLAKINLTGADLSGSNLNGSRLVYAKLTGANLTGVNLSGAYLGIADLTNTNLTRANLSNTKLYETNFTNANLTNANLANIEFEKTNFRRANLQGIQFEGTSFLSTNLTEAKNLPSPMFSPLFIPTNHPDTDLVNSLGSLTEGLLYFSESEYLYDIFLWNRAIRGEFTLEKFLKEMGHLKPKNLQSLQSVEFDTKQPTRKYQVLLDKIKAELFDLEIYQFETNYIREGCSKSEIPYIIVGRTAVGDWFAAIIGDNFDVYGTSDRFGENTDISTVTEMNEALTKDDAAMTKAEHLNLISAVEEADAEIEGLIWSLAEDRDLMLHKLLLATDIFMIEEDYSYVIQEDYYEDYEEEDMGEAEKLEQEKREVLAQLVLNNLSNIRVYFVGEFDIDVYLIGQTTNQDWLGIHTRMSCT
ncbi:MAG: pentapeptide repeat-containing protein [Microcoleaceae cyanobacterium]